MVHDEKSENRKTGKTQERKLWGVDAEVRLVLLVVMMVVRNLYTKGRGGQRRGPLVVEVHPSYTPAGTAEEREALIYNKHATHIHKEPNKLRRGQISV